MEPAPPPRPSSPPRDDVPRRYRDAPTHLADDGYVWEWCPTHPRAAHGVVPQHRLAVEVRLGRFLTKRERVHHRNRCRWDNRPENLELHESHASHMREHWQGRGRNDPALVQLVREAAADPARTVSSLPMSPTTARAICLAHGIAWRSAPGRSKELTEAKVRAALQGRTTREAATHLGVSASRLYARYGHLLRKRASPGSLDPHREEVLRLAHVERTPHAEIGRRFGVSEACVHKSLRRWRAPGATSDESAAPPPRPGA